MKFTFIPQAVIEAWRELPKERRRELLELAVEEITEAVASGRTNPAEASDWTVALHYGRIHGAPNPLTPSDPIRYPDNTTDEGTSALD